jgi:hypothetical protein
MIEIMKSRGVIYKPDPVYAAAYKKAQAYQDKKLEEQVKMMFPKYFTDDKLDSKG